MFKKLLSDNSAGVKMLAQLTCMVLGLLLAIRAAGVLVIDRLVSGDAPNGDAVVSQLPVLALAGVYIVLMIGGFKQQRWAYWSACMLSLVICAGGVACGLAGAPPFASSFVLILTGAASAANWLALTKETEAEERSLSTAARFE
ncbi:MAG: hypothetical protein U1D55_01990 [Phycisphaerae bacterium]